jgi:alanine racemase
MPTRPCWVETSIPSLQDNYRFLKSLAAPDVELLTIVKSNAHGHSLELYAPARPATKSTLEAALLLEASSGDPQGNLYGICYRSIEIRRARIASGRH